MLKSVMQSHAHKQHNIYWYRTSVHDLVHHTPCHISVTFSYFCSSCVHHSHLPMVTNRSVKTCFNGYFSEIQISSLMPPFTSTYQKYNIKQLSGLSAQCVSQKALLLTISSSKSKMSACCF